MKKTARVGSFKRIVVGVVLVAYVAGCTHTPTGEKAFENFDQCIAANIGLAAVGGGVVGALSAAFTRKVSGSRGASNVVGAAAGIATAVMIGQSAWRKCAAVYSKSEVTAVSAPPPVRQDSPHRPATLALDKLDVVVSGDEDTAPVPEFSFTHFADDPAAKDIKANLRHRVEIVRFMAGNDDRLVLADAHDRPLLDGSGNPIPLEMAHTLPRQRLSWTTIAEEGQQDYVEPMVIQQGASAGKHHLKVPPRAQLPLPLPVPMRYTLTVEASGMKASRSVDFAILNGQNRPRRYYAPRVTAAVQSQPAVAVSQVSATRSVSVNEFVVTHTLKRTSRVYSDTGAKRKVLARLPARTGVRVEDEAQVRTGKRMSTWVKVVSQGGKGGWLPVTELKEVK